MNTADAEFRKRRRAQRKIYKATVLHLLEASRDGIWIEGGKERERIRVGLIEAGFRPEKAERLKQSLYQKAQNFNERVELRRVRKQVLERVSLVHAGKSAEEINAIVDQIVGAVAQPKKVEKPKREDPMMHPEVRAVWEARRAERKRQVKANKHRRKMR